MTVAQSTPKNYWFYLVCLVISFAFYGNSLKNGFSMDDDLVTTTDKQKHHSIEEGILGFKKIFTSRYANDGKQSYAYRPITTYSFAIEYDLFKNSENRAQNSHFISILLYAIAGMVLFKYLLLLFENKRWWFAALATFIFMIHPIHSEVVNSIKSRDELLAFIFGFAFLIQAIKYVDTKKWTNLIGAFVFMYLSVFSKETGTVFVALLPVSIYFFRNKNIKQLIIAILVIALSYFAIKKGMNIILNKESVRYFLYFENPLYTLDFSYRIPMFFYSILLYVGLLIIPYPLKYYYGYEEIPLIGYGDWQFYVGLVVVGAILYFILKGLKEKKFYSFILLFFMLAIGGAGNLLFPLPGIIGERFAFIASVGFSLFVGWLVYRLTQSKLEDKIHAARIKPVMSVLGLVTLISMVYSFQRNKDWESTYSLYSADMSKLENSMKAHSLLATEYTTKASAIQRSGNLDLFNEMVDNTDLALQHYGKALDIYDQYANTHNNIGFIHYNLRNDVLSGLPYWKRAVELDTGYQEALFNLGSAYGKVKRNYDELSIFLELPTSIDFVPSEKELLHLSVTETKADIQELLRAWESLGHLEGIYRNIYSNKNLNPNLARTYGSFVSNYVDYKGGVLKEINAGEVVKNITATQSIPNQTRQLRDVLMKVRRTIANRLSKGMQTEEHSFEHVFRTGSYAYRDSFYSAFEQLYRVDSMYIRQYNTVSQFSAIDRKPKKMIEWGWRLIKAFPEEAGTGYAQIGLAYENLRDTSKALIFYQQAMQSIESRILGFEKSAEKKSSNQLNELNKEIQKIEAKINQLSKHD